MQYPMCPRMFVCASIALASFAQDVKTIPLTVAPGVPLRVYLTKRLTKRQDETVHAKLIEPLFAFDREVVPAGSTVEGRVSTLKPVSKYRRFSAIIGGDFTPLHQAQVEFTTLLLPDGRKMQLRTAETPGLSTLYNPSAKAHKQNGGILGTAEQQVQGRIDSAIDTVRSPGKMELIEEYLVRRLPWHPQWIRRGTRFDAELLSPLDFGTETVKTADLQLLGSQPPQDSVVHSRLITPLDSGISKPGETVEAVVSAPLFSSGHKLILPEGAHLTGAVTVAHRARWFHRGGQIRFNFRTIDLPAGMERAGLAPQQPAQEKTMATLKAAESGGASAVKVDDEGSVKATEPKTRFIAPALAALVAMKSADNDEGKRTGTPDNNTGGRTLGGASGLGLLGAAAAQASRPMATALGFYGLAWSVYSNLISRGSEVQFNKDAALDIRFGERPAVPAKHFRLNALGAQSFTSQ